MLLSERNGITPPKAGVEHDVEREARLCANRMALLIPGNFLDGPSEISIRFGFAHFDV